MHLLNEQVRALAGQLEGLHTRYFRALNREQLPTELCVRGQLGDIVASLSFVGRDRDPAGTARVNAIRVEYARTALALLRKIQREQYQRLRKSRMLFLAIEQCERIAAVTEVEGEYAVRLDRGALTNRKQQVAPLLEMHRQEFKKLRAAFREMKSELARLTRELTDMRVAA